MQMRFLAAEAVAREAGALARKRFSDAPFKVGFKGPQDYLPEVDGETEDLISGILPVREAGGYTRNFLTGYSLTNGNPLIACAPGLKSSVITAAPIEGIVL